MPQKCSKRLSGLTWALFECMFFSSVVLGWTWLSIVFRHDGYFTETCNVTFANVTPPRGNQAKGDQPAQQTVFRTETRKRPCRTRRDSLVMESQASDIGLRAGPRLLHTGLRNAPHLDDFHLKVAPRGEYAIGRAAPRTVGSHTTDSPSKFRLHANFNGLQATPQEEETARRVGSYPRDDYRKEYPLPHSSTKIGLRLPSDLRSRAFVVPRTVENDRYHGDNNTSHDSVKSTGPPRSTKDGHLWRAGRLISQISGVSRIQQGAATASQGRYKRDRQYDAGGGGVGHSDQASVPTRPPTPQVLGYCLEQNEQIRLMFALVLIIRDLLTFPVGAFYDKHGTTKTRLLTVLIFALGTLMMIFTSYHVPWLVVPALALTAIAGSAVLLTNLQTANLFGRKRHLVVSLYVGAAYSDGIITLLMQLSHFDGVNLQTSFMFLTIGIVPLLVSTVAFLPKTRIPWPLPADYGKRRNKSLDEDLLRKQRAWQRRMSEDPDLDLAPHLFPDSSPFPEANGGRCRKPPPEFSPLAMQSLFVVSCVWFGLQRLQEAVFDTRVVNIADMELVGSVDYETYYGIVQLMAVLVSPLAGLLIDRPMPRELGSTQATQQMRRIVPSIAVTSSLGVVQVIIDMYSDPVAQSVAAVVNLLHKVFAHTTMCAFVMHLHFNHQHLGKYYGLTCAVSAVISAFQFPVRIFLIEMTSSIMPAQILLLLLSLLSFGHAINVWDQCRRRLIRDHSDRSSERFQAQAQGGVVPLSVYIETDESNLPANNSTTCADGGSSPVPAGKGDQGTASLLEGGSGVPKGGARGNGKHVVVVVGDCGEEGTGKDLAMHQNAAYVEGSIDAEAPTTKTDTGLDGVATATATGHPYPLDTRDLSPTEDQERNDVEDIDDEDFDVDESSPSNMLEFAKL